MSITRAVDTDSDGTPTTGTIHNNAWLQAIYDTLDARWSRVTITSTGSVNNLNISEADFVIFNNASDLTVTGISAPSSPAKPGKPVRFICTGAGNVFFAHNSGSSSAGNKLWNIARGGNTPCAGGSGCGMFVYDDANSRWALVHHEQGAWIAFTPTTSAASGTWTVDNPGDIGTCQYWLKGRTLCVAVSFATTTTSLATATVSITIPLSLTANKQMVNECRFVETATDATGIMYANASGTTIAFQKNSGNIGALTNNLAVQGELHLEVQ